MEQTHAFIALSKFCVPHPQNLANSSVMREKKMQDGYTAGAFGMTIMSTKAQEEKKQKGRPAMDGPRPLGVTTSAG